MDGGSWGDLLTLGATWTRQESVTLQAAISGDADSHAKHYGAAQGQSGAAEEQAKRLNMPLPWGFLQLHLERGCFFLYGYSWQGRVPLSAGGSGGLVWKESGSSKRLRLIKAGQWM